MFALINIYDDLLKLVIMTIPLVLNQDIFYCKNNCIMPTFTQFPDIYGNSAEFQTFPIVVDDKSMCAAFILSCPLGYYVSGADISLASTSDVHVYSSSTMTLYCGAIDCSRTTYYVAYMDKNMTILYNNYNSIGCLGTCNCMLMSVHSAI